MRNPIIPIEENPKNSAIVIQDVAQKKDVSIILKDGKFEFGGFNDVLTFSKAIASSSLVPSSFKNKPSDIAVCISMGLEKDLTPFQSLSSICVINGRPAIWGDALIGLAQKTGELESLEVEFNKEERKTKKWACTVTVKRKTMAKPVSCTYTWEQAIDSGSTSKQVWKAHPERMLESKPRAYALRTAFADVFCGLYTVEEMQDVQTEQKDITPKVASLDKINKE